MSDKTINIDETLKGWKAYYLSTDQTSFATASNTSNHERDTSGDLIIDVYNSDVYSWKDLPTYGIVALKMFVIDASEVSVNLVHNG